MPSLLILALVVGAAVANSAPRPELIVPDPEIFTCLSDGQRRDYGDKWTTPSGFVKTCTSSKGRISVSIVACKSILGVDIAVGSSVNEEGYKITCRPSGSSVFKDFEPLFACMGKYNIGEKWIEKTYFHYECKMEGPVLVSCLSEDGKKAIALGGNEFYNGVIYRCIEKDGSIYMNRETPIRRD